MKQEEIEKAAEEYAKRLNYSMEAKHNMCQEDFKIAFKAGVEYANKYWQEKTRWIPVEERLPEVRKLRFFIAVKTHNDSNKFKANIETFLIRDESDVLWVGMNCKYWKEIEL